MSTKSSSKRLIVMALLGLVLLGGAWFYMQQRTGAVFTEEADGVLASTTEYLHETDGYQNNEALFDGMLAECDKSARSKAGNDRDTYEKLMLQCLIDKLKAGGFDEQTRRFNIRRMSLE